MRDLRREASLGAAAGTAGTVAMTILMKPGIVGYLPPRWRPTEFVPKQIVEWMERVAGVEGALTERQEMVVAMITHLGYGAGMGALYGTIRSRSGALPAPLAGAVWGLAVWAFGYEGWLPALGVRPATTDQPPTKWPVPIANHLLFGVTTALVFERLRR